MIPHRKIGIRESVLGCRVKDFFFNRGWMLPKILINHITKGKSEKRNTDKEIVVNKQRRSNTKKSK